MRDALPTHTPTVGTRVRLRPDLLPLPVPLVCVLRGRAGVPGRESSPGTRGVPPVTPET